MIKLSFSWFLNLELFVCMYGYRILKLIKHCTPLKFKFQFVRWKNLLFSYLQNRSLIMAKVTLSIFVNKNRKIRFLSYTSWQHILHKKAYISCSQSGKTIFDCVVRYCSMKLDRTTTGVHLWSQSAIYIQHQHNISSLTGFDLNQVLNSDNSVISSKSSLRINNKSPHR